MLISFDGIDSSGKATQSHRLAERLRYIGHTVHEFTTPDYTTPSGKELKAWLQSQNGNWHALVWQEKNKLFATNRAENQKKVADALAANEIVVYDRYVPSSLAFITVEATTPQDVNVRRADIHRVVEKLEYEANRMPREDISIFLDVPVAVSTTLLEKRKQARADADEYTDHVHVMERLYNEYDIMCREQPARFLRLKVTEGTELLPIEAVSELVWESLKTRFPDLVNRATVKG